MSDFDVDAFIEYHVGDCSCEHGHECQSCTMKRELKKAIKELSTRVAEIEGARKRACVDAEILAKENEELRNRLSTLLKASEGMERALEECTKALDDGYANGFREDSGRYAHPRAKQALSDFRAVKEGL